MSRHRSLKSRLFSRLPMLAAALSLSLVASACFVPAVEARAMVQGKRAQQLPMAEEEFSAAALGSAGEGRGRLRDEVAKEVNEAKARARTKALSGN